MRWIHFCWGGALKLWKPKPYLLSSFRSTRECLKLLYSTQPFWNLENFKNTLLRPLLIIFMNVYTRGLESWSMVLLEKIFTANICKYRITTEHTKHYLCGIWLVWLPPLSTFFIVYYTHRWTSPKFGANVCSSMWASPFHMQCLVFYLISCVCFWHSLFKNN